MSLKKSDFHYFNYQKQYLVGCTVAIKTKRPTLESFQSFIGQIQHVIIALNIISHSVCLKNPSPSLNLLPVDEWGMGKSRNRLSFVNFTSNIWFLTHRHNFIIMSHISYCINSFLQKHILKDKLVLRKIILRKYLFSQVGFNFIISTPYFGKRELV